MSDLSYLHFAFGVLSTPVAAETAYRLNFVPNYAKAVAYSAVAILSVGLLKEVNDVYRVAEFLPDMLKGIPELKDVVLDSAGVAIGSSVAFVGNGLRRNKQR